MRKTIIFILFLFILILLIYGFFINIELTIINLNEITPKKSFKTTEFVCEYGDTNITLNDFYNCVNKLGISDNEANNIYVTVKDKKRLVIIKNIAAKFITKNDSLWVVDKTYKHLSGYMGIEIKNVKIGKFYTKKNCKIFYKEGNNTN